MRMMLFLLFVVMAVQTASAAVFRVEGDTLIYNTEDTDGVGSISFDDEDKLLKILQTHKNIKLITLKSAGGMANAAMVMANIIIDAQLDTHVDKNCSSACVRLLLAGKKRTATLGAQIGFHRGRWTAESMERYYNATKDENNWSSPFEFAAWVYDDVKKNVYEYSQYLKRRGVADYVAAYSYRLGFEEMWFMRRAELLSSGILTE